MALAVGKIIEGNVYQRVAGGGDVVFVLGLRQQQGIQGGVVTVERRGVDLAQRQECAVGMFCHLSFCHGKAGVVGAAARGHCEERSKEQY